MYAKHAGASNKGMHLPDAILNHSGELDVMYIGSAVGGWKLKTLAGCPVVDLWRWRLNRNITA